MTRAHLLAALRRLCDASQGQPFGHLVLHTLFMDSLLACLAPAQRTSSEEARHAAWRFLQDELERGHRLRAVTREGVEFIAFTPDYRSNAVPDDVTELESPLPPTPPEPIAGTTPPEAPAPEDPVLTADQAAEIANVRPRTIRTWCASGRLPAFRTHADPHGGRWRIRRSDLLTLLSASSPTRPGNKSP